MNALMNRHGNIKNYGILSPVGIAISEIPCESSSFEIYSAMSMCSPEFAAKDAFC